MATEKTTVKHSTLSGYSVLAIDNNGMLLDMMKEMYRQSGVKCDTCQSVDELTDRMRTKDYDLLVTDLKMPEVNGYEVLELLRTSEIGNSQTRKSATRRPSPLLQPPPQAMWKKRN